MSKNAVQRLQKIENDLKTAISIYDVASKTNNESENLGKRSKRGSSQRRTESKKHSNSFISFGKEQTTPSEACKKTVSFIPRPVEDFQSVKVRCRSSKKPRSAPSSSNMSTTTGESEQMHKRNRQLRSERDSMSKIVDDFQDGEWMESHPPLESELFMSPSKVLETANKVLSENHYQIINEGTRKHNEYERPNEIINSYASKNENKENNMSSRRCLKHGKGEAAYKKIGNKRSEMITNSSLRVTFKQINSKDAEIPNKHCSRVESKKKSLEKSPRHTIQKKIPKLEKRDKTPSPGFSNRRSYIKSFGQNKETKERQNRAWSCDKYLMNSRCTSRDRSSSSEEVKRRSQSYPSRISIRNRDEINKMLKEKSGSESTEEKYDESEQFYDTCDIKDTFELDEEDDSDIGVDHLSRIIEQSNKKLQKMKVSKNLALDIAKQLKEKYEEVQLSNKELRGMLKKVEKDNEKLKNAVKDANDSKIKLKLKMEEIRIDSETMLLQQGIKTKEVVEENNWLKTKMKELENQRSQEMLDKQQRIDRIQRDIRLLESQNELRPQTPPKEDVRGWIQENSELSKKIKDLESFLAIKQSKVEALEGRVRDLEKELEKQNNQLKQKAERLENTNCELESIRLTSKDLEEQVKMLRLNIENFDLVHENLVKRSSNYETEIKAAQEQIKKLKEENAKMATELENERDSLLIKNKIIDDQQETIRQLREKSEENKILLKRNQSLERILNVEREEKLELQEAIERLKRKKEDLKKKVKALEHDLLIAPQEVVRDLQKTQIVLHELENQVQIKQKEWELHLKSLIKEKEQACSVAEFATKKLMQTTNEFQKQSEAHKRLHRVLAENLAAKERRRKEANEKMATQAKQLAENTTTMQKLLNADGINVAKCLQHYNPVSDATLEKKDPPIWLPRRTFTSFYVPCSRKTENFL